MNGHFLPSQFAAARETQSSVWIQLCKRMTFFSRASLLALCATMVLLGVARGDEECISDQAGLQSALMVEDGSKVLFCADTTIEISSTVEILPTAKVTLECEKKGRTCSCRNKQFRARHTHQAMCVRYNLSLCKFGFSQSCLQLTVRAP